MKMKAGSREEMEKQFPNSSMQSNSRESAGCGWQAKEPMMGEKTEKKSVHIIVYFTDTSAVETPLSHLTICHQSTQYAIKSPCLQIHLSIYSIAYCRVSRFFGVPDCFP
jgi:hypothetical protein